ncbi:MAG: CAP domain-containing protein [Patescibacteria group bacterium]
MDFFRRVSEHVLPGPHNSYRPHLLRRQWLVLFLGVALAAEALLVGNLALRQAGVPFLAAVVQNEILDRTNHARAEFNAPVLRESPLLTAAAHAKAADMAAKDYFAHVGPDGKVPWAWLHEVGYDYRLAGENLAVRFVDSRDVVDAWMNSPSHRANIIKQGYTEIGVGVASGHYKGEPAVYVVQYFGAPQASFLAGQGAAAATSGSFINSFVRQVGRYFADPRHAAALVLSLIAAALVAVLGLSVFRHVQIQPVEVLIPGAAVTAVVIALLWLNSVALGPSPTGTADIGSGIELGEGMQAEALGG